LEKGKEKFFHIAAKPDKTADMRPKYYPLFLLLFFAPAKLFAVLPTPIPMQSATCTPTPTPAATPACEPFILGDCTETDPDAGEADSPTPTPIPTEFQPPDQTLDPPTMLKWRVFPPTDGSSPPWPAVLVVHAGNFWQGGYYGDNNELVAQDLAAAGYYALIVNYRLAPCHQIAGQYDHTDPASGRPPQQTDDIETEIKAIRSDTLHCNGKVGVVGGSSGGSHAVFAGVNKTASTGWPNWVSSDRPQAVVSCSGAFEYSDRDDKKWNGQSYANMTAFIKTIENYTNTCVREEQKTFSPVRLINYSVGMRPIFAINTAEDNMPWHQLICLQCALQDAGVPTTNYRVWSIPGSDLHAFHYWRSPIKDTNPVINAIRVRDRAIEFLDTYLK
jgi:acetyl esterase/lipase